MSKTAQATANDSTSDIEFYKSLDIQYGSIYTAKQIVQFNIEMDQPVGLFGRAGLGKTELIRQIAEEMGMDLMVLYLHHMDKEDISGFPFPDPTDENYVLMRVKKYLPKAKSKRKGTILFLDEWNRAERPVVNAMFTIMEKPRRAGDLVLPDDVRVVLSGNNSDAQYAVNESEREPAIRRRVNWFGVVANAGAWIEHATRAGFHPSVISYVRAHKQALYDVEAHNAGRVGATPASWEKVSNAVKHAEKKSGGKLEGMDSSLEGTLRGVVSGFLGVRTATDFVTELLQHDHNIVSPEEILSGFKPGDEAHDKVKRMVKSRAGGASGRISQLASSLALTVATTQPAPISVVGPIAEFANLLEGDVLQKFLEELVKQINEMDTSEGKQYMKKFSQILGQQPAYMEARKRQTQKATALEKQIAK